MQLFSAKDKGFGCYITVTWILMSVSDIANANGMIRGIFSERGEIAYSFLSKSCVENGIEKGILVERINLLTHSGVDVNIVDFDEEIVNSKYTDLIEKVAIDCNGRVKCNSSYSGLSIPRPTLYGVPVDFINMRFSCFSASIDNRTVFNIGLDFGLKIPTIYWSYYIVLRLQNNKKTRRHCKINGGWSDISIRVLHVDFGPLPKCNKINSDTLHKCYGNMTLVSRDHKECNYTWQPPFTYRRIRCNAEDVDIDVHMSTGFVWMELYAFSGIKLNCSGSNSYHDETSYSPTSDTTQTLVENFDGSNPNEPTDETDRSKFNYMYPIVIPASVPFLTILIGIVSIAICVCCRAERNRISNYEVPSMTQEDTVV